jgi:ribosomal protein S18 acetylase RimI-like enzyme
MTNLPQMTEELPTIVRRAEARDAAALGRLGATLVRVHHVLDRARFLPAGAGIETGYGRFLETQLRDEHVVIFVAERADRVVGYVYAAVEPRSWKELRDVAGFVHDIVVEAETRHVGIGTQLLEAAAAWLVARGVPRVMLWTAERNIDAQRLFERLGFRRTMVEMTREAPTPGPADGEGV